MKPGTVVMLMPSGPKMTVVAEAAEDGLLRCGWFVQDDHYTTSLFHYAAVAIVHFRDGSRPTPEASSP